MTGWRTTLWLAVLIQSLVCGVGVATKTGVRASLTGFAGGTTQAGTAKLMGVDFLSSRMKL